MQLAFGVAGVILVVPARPVAGTRLRRRPNAQWGRSITGSRYARGGPHTPALGWLIPVVVRAAASRVAGFLASEEPGPPACQLRSSSARGVASTG
jgi:hypothetical protein